MKINFIDIDTLKIKEIFRKIFIEYLPKSNNLELQAIEINNLQNEMNYDINNQELKVNMNEEI